ncbi:hypothetical protein MKS88_002982 [Plasmodium brasilianum]|uniref:Uncharacterized protein n=2 Tax=Plasmodium (Plasmodium) TaxID=418103 RepID=A0A1D3PCA9_PLAMA|nr:conserved Plasmodium membrane protein, unknown function [Plasmodium malariae]KAI4838501.1 hypothetical protein MKS88_002982 [Plasmodium brasilianum]SCN12900.1 conserved Plasmodium membrane protein, unknown function [Plasmodium malariae]
MKILNYICGRPLRSGGTAPLIYNPVRKWLIILMILYFCLCILSYGIFLFPKASDLHCSYLSDSLFNFSLSIGASYLMAPYYSIISCREWGTEIEWAIVAIVSAVMAIIDVSSSCYGIYVLYTIVDVVFTDVSGMTDCNCYKAILFFSANSFLIFLHLVVAIVSIAVYFLLMTRIEEQLEDNRNII